MEKVEVLLQRFPAIPPSFPGAGFLGNLAYISAFYAEKPALFHFSARLRAH
jgi:hypothetical protein